MIFAYTCRNQAEIHSQGRFFDTHLKARAGVDRQELDLLRKVFRHTPESAPHFRSRGNLFARK
jgi:hypothetical protein